MKKAIFRKKLLEYILANTKNNRIPTVSELRTALKSTNYMVMQTLKELKQQGLLVCNSTKSGTFITNAPKLPVIGIMLEEGKSCEFIDFPAWLSGFTKFFAENNSCILRSIQQTKWDDLEKTIETNALDVLVVLASNSNVMKNMSSRLSKKVMINFCRIAESVLQENSCNVIYSDTTSWKTEYVRAAKEHNCRSFLQFSRKNDLSKKFAAEIVKQGLDWEDGRCFSTLDESVFRKKLPKLIEKYNINAVRCEGGIYQDFFCSQLKNFPDFKPFMPLYGDHNMVVLKQKYPYIKSQIVMEHLGNYNFRWGYFAAECAVNICTKNTVFPGMIFPMERYNNKQTILFPQNMVNINL